MAEECQKSETLLFLGTGATTGSGIRKNENPLPTDREFFIHLNNIVPNWKQAYPALALYRETPNNCRKPLFQTWNDLFIYRSQGRSGVIRENQETIDKFNHLANHSFLADHAWRREHYHQQFRIMRPELRNEYYLAEMAIWDLRTLVMEVYDDKVVLNGNVYPSFFERINVEVGKICAVVNLNYDTTFDDGIEENGVFPFYYPGNREPDNDMIAIIRPHGSLGWTSRSGWALGKGWAGWTETYDNTQLNEIGFRPTDNQDFLEFKQPLVVPPAQFKEEIIGNSTLPGLQNNILRQQWITLERALRKCNTWVFFGISFAAGDDHLMWLLRRYSKGKNIFCSRHGVNNCQNNKGIKRLQRELLNLEIRIMTTNDEENIDQFVVVENPNNN
jgi:hypothetical protein